jgi:hypothetical protein
VNDAEHAAVQALMATQHGAITVDQLECLGITQPRRLAAVRRALLVKVAPGVYASPASPPTVARHRTVGLLALGPDAVLSHDAAAELHGFDRTPRGNVEFTVERSRRGRRMPFTVHTTFRLGHLDRVTVDGFRCTSATRTVLDLARARVGRLRLEAAIDSAVRSGLSAPRVLADRLDELRGPGRWGTPLLETLLIDSGGHTMLERCFLELMRRADLPDPGRRWFIGATAEPTRGSTSTSRMPASS